MVKESTSLGGELDILPPRVPVYLTPEQKDYALAVAPGRYQLPASSRAPDSGFGSMEVDVIGAFAEVAVCVHYGEDYREQVVAYRERSETGARPDVTIHRPGREWRVSVKGRRRFDNPYLIVPEYDVDNDIYILCSVAIQFGYVELRGYITGERLRTYQPESWKWTSDRPGASARRRQQLRRYVPLKDLHAIEANAKERV